MPGMSGLKMLTKVWTERPKGPVIMITAYGAWTPNVGHSSLVPRGF